MNEHREYIETNRAYWDERVDTHMRSDFYDLASFKAGASSLDSVELEGVGDVEGKTLLHLQCHFGMDTLSWARRGAIATGADFSPEAIRSARALSEELGVPATFVEANLYDLPKLLEGQYDVVFTSHGTIVWLPDIRGWAQVVSHFLKPGGRFVFVDAHPAMFILDYEAEDELRVKYDYFQGPDPVIDEWAGTYADPASVHQNTRQAEWNHTLGDVITALVEAGLRIEWVREYPFVAWQYLPQMRQGDDGWWRLPDEYPKLPFLVSIRATKD